MRTYARRLHAVSLLELKVALIALALGLTALAHGAASLARMVHRVQEFELASGLLCSNGYLFVLEDGGPRGTEPPAGRLVIERIRVHGTGRALQLGGTP